MEKYFKIIILIFCLSLTLFYKIMPQAIGKTPTAFNQSMLSILMLGICFGFIYGVGFKPKFIVWKILFSWYSSLTLIALALMLLYVV